MPSTGHRPARTYRSAAEKLRLIHPVRGGTSVYDASMPQVSTLGDAHIGFEGFGQIGRYAWNLFRAFDSSGSAGGGHDRR